LECSVDKIPLFKAMILKKTSLLKISAAGSDPEFLSAALKGLSFGCFIKECCRIFTIYWETYDVFFKSFFETLIA